GRQPGGGRRHHGIRISVAIDAENRGPAATPAPFSCPLTQARPLCHLSPRSKGVLPMDQERADAPRKAVRLRISGKVQGVWYRAWAVREATALRLDGWVRNR